MTGKWKWTWTAVFAVLLFGTAWADEISELRKEQEKLYNQLAEMNNRLLKMEAAQKEQAQKLAKVEESGGFEIPETLSWLEKIKLYGDFRYRYECRDRDWRSDPKDDRHRIRARVGVQFKINEEYLFDFRVATSEFLKDENDAIIPGSAANAANQTLGDYWAGKNLWVDRAYVSYTPKAVEGLTIAAGKIYNPFYVGKSDLIWDGDVNPEGIALQYTKPWTEKDELFVNAFAGYVEENGSSADKRMFGGQVGLAHTFEDKSKATLGVSYYDYSNVEGTNLPAINDQVIDNGAAGNSNDGTNYLYDYNLFNAFGQYAFKLGTYPFAAFGDYVVNTASGVKEDTGWLAGLTFNKAKDPGTWDFTYSYRDLEADAVLGAFADSDFADGGTNVKGHKFNWTYMLAKNTSFGVSYYLADKLSQKPNEDYKRVQFDFIVKF
ncbi:MAG TPA: putative porin [Anaerohalosphaeraceae bacterium]|nr:putative porin [Anaerohalosphaeraceae bacterium]HOL87937.1 putative porin [Anaerohalosphaeraceae bacterium]HPP55436.1 putative porin [Anaerohalosphaeraceae bacterium]